MMGADELLFTLVRRHHLGYRLRLTEEEADAVIACLERLAIAEEMVAETVPLRHELADTQQRLAAAEADADRLAVRVKAIPRWSAEDQEAYVLHDDAVARRSQP
jgi:hypothetical protein